MIKLLNTLLGKVFRHEKNKVLGNGYNIKVLYEFDYLSLLYQL